MRVKRRLSIPWPRVALIAALCALVTLPRVLEIGTFVAFDETFYWERANRFFVALLKHDWPGTIVDPRPAVVNMWVQALGLSFKYLLPQLLSGQPRDVLHLMELERPFTFSLLGEKRLAMGLANSAAILLLESGAFGDRLAGAEPLLAERFAHHARRRFDERPDVSLSRLVPAIPAPGALALPGLIRPL
jgi:hypothetical protein